MLLENLPNLYFNVKINEEKKNEENENNEFICIWDTD